MEAGIKVGDGGLGLGQRARAGRRSLRGGGEGAIENNARDQHQCGEKNELFAILGTGLHQA